MTGSWYSWCFLGSLHKEEILTRCERGKRRRKNGLELETGGENRSLVKDGLVSEVILVTSHCDNFLRLGLLGNCEMRNGGRQVIRGAITRRNRGIILQSVGCVSVPRH